MTKGLHIERKIGSLGDCKRINAYENGQDIGCAVFSATDLIWWISLLDKNNTVSDFSVHYADDSQAAMQQVENIIRLFYRDQYAAPARRAA